MDAYTSFAKVYDLFMDNVPYESWSKYLVELLREHGIRDGLVLDLGCGTGKMARLLADAGYDMIGVDNSVEMLDIAREEEQSKEKKEGRKDILYLLQDMQEFELYGTVSAVYSGCDSFNYILNEEELFTVFRLVNNYLDPGGLFVFDMNTPFKYQKLLAENTFAENREESSFIWENYYDEESRINEYDLTLFIRKQKEKEPCFLRFSETHYQKSYSLSTIRRLIEEAGMEWVAVYDDYTREPLGEESERMLILARECKKENSISEKSS